MVPFAERLTMSQMAAMTVRSEGRDPWACPRCGCHDWRVVRTYERADGARRRVRLCRHCGHELPTLERPEATNPPPLPDSPPPPDDPPDLLAGIAFNEPEPRTINHEEPMKRSTHSSNGHAPKARFAWEYRGQSGTIQANTRTEARAQLKEILGMKRLPAGIVLEQQAGLGCPSAPMPIADRGETT